MDTWLIIHTPGGPHLFNLGAQPENIKEELITRARVLLAFPPGEEWLSDFANWQLMESPGEPEKLRPRATLHELRELQAVSDVDLQAYRQRCDESRKTACMSAARQAVASLDAAQREQLRAELAGSTSTSPRITGGRQ